VNTEPAPNHVRCSFSPSPADFPMSDQAHHWSQAALRYEEEFIDPYHPGVRNPLLKALAKLAGRKRPAAADLGCGTGPLLPVLARRFRKVYAVDFAEGMLARARERCRGLSNVTFFRRSFTDLAGLPGPVDVAVAVNSLILPDVGDLERALEGIHALLRPGGTFLGIVPGMDAVHYLTMLLVDRARQTGMPQAAARKNAAVYAEHELYDLAFGDFRYRGLVQHFWQPFEVAHRLRQAGFRKVRLAKVGLTWEQFGAVGKDLEKYEPPWDWFFRAEKKD
jgi:SAM-dependent methyltransferase